jgi:hypothetical protein
MDSQSGILEYIISNAIKSAFSKFSQQQRYERTYYQQLMTSANTVFSYDPIQQQGHEGPSRTTTASTGTVPGSAYDDCLMPSFLHQHKSYQPVEIPQTIPVPSPSLSPAQDDLFCALGYTPQPLAQEDLFSAFGYTPADATHIQESTCLQYIA